jgi:membrane protein
MERTARWLAGFAVFAARRLREQQGLQIAASLAYTTLLSLVPLLTIMFAVPEMFPGSARFGDTLHEFIFNNLVPEVGDTVREHLREFSANASRLTLTGITLLILIALMLMATIDDALNRIWHARRRRRAASRFLIYWAMITLGPLLVGAGLVSTTYLLSLPVLTEMDSALSVQTRLLSLLPFLTTATAFTLLYALVPDCHVRLRHACVGGIVAAVLFEAAKFGFGIYVRSAGTEQIYGALAVLPLFLVWIYASWVIVLFGAHFTYCLAEFQHGAAARRAPEGWGFADAFMVVRALWQAQQTGASVAARELPRRGVHLSPPALQEILACLAAGRWIEETAAGGWVLCRDPGTVTLLDLHRLVPRRLPLAEDGELPEELKPALSAYRDDLGKRLDVPLEKLFGAAH